MLQLQSLELVYFGNIHFDLLTSALKAENFHFFNVFGLAKRALDLPTCPFPQTHQVETVPTAGQNVAALFQAN